MKNTNKSIKNSIKISKKTIIAVIITIIAIYVVIVVSNLIKNPTDTVMIENGKLYSEEQVAGYIIRDEIVIKGKNYKNGMEKIVNEGERAAKDESVFRYYTTGEENLIKKIQEVSLKIQEALSSENINPTGDIKVLEN